MEPADKDAPSVAQENDIKGMSMEPDITFVKAVSVAIINGVFTHCYELPDGRNPHAIGRLLIVGPPELLEELKGHPSWKVVEIPEDNRDDHIGAIAWRTENYKRPLTHKQCLNGGLGCKTTQEDDDSFTRVHSEWCNLHDNWEHWWDTKDVTTGDTMPDVIRCMMCSAIISSGPYCSNCKPNMQ